MINPFKQSWLLDMKDFILRYLLPISILFITIVYMSNFIYGASPEFIRAALGIYILSLLLYPFIKLSQVGNTINKNLPFFVIYSAALSTVFSNYSKFFEFVIEKEEFPYISRFLEKVKDLAIKWRLGYAEAMKRVAKLSPSKLFRSFLDRFSASVEFGEELFEYFRKEHKILMDEYEVEYKRSLENIRTLQEVFSSLTISIAFSIVVLFQLPVLVGMSIDSLMTLVLLMVFIVDLLIYGLTKNIVFQDPLLHNLRKKPREYINVIRMLLLTIPFSICMFYLLEAKFPNYPLLFKFTLSISPLAYVGFKAKEVEALIRKKEEIFPAFLSSLSGALAVRGTGIIKALEAIKIHEFSLLTEHINKLINSIRATLEVEKSWYHFVAEIGSNLIARYSLLFAKVSRMGADVEKIARMILDSYLRMIDLRKYRMQFAASLRGMVYGSAIGFVLTLYLGLEILRMIISLFSQISEVLSQELSGLVGPIFFGSPEVINMDFIYLVVQIITIIHFFFAALILKEVEGGLKPAMFVDLIILMWLGTAIAIGIPAVMSKLVGL